MTEKENQKIIELCDEAFGLIYDGKLSMYRVKISDMLTQIKNLVLQRKTEKEIKATNKEWENIYACYVIREAGHRGNYIMETSEARCALRESAVRFTKQQIINFIGRHKDEKFIVEDAK